MKCYTHEGIDAITACANCGVGICKECEENSMFRFDNKALCQRCDRLTLDEQIGVSEKFLRTSVIKLVIYGSLFIFGLSPVIRSLMAPGESLPLLDAILGMLSVWGFATVGSLFRQPSNRSVKREVSDALLEFRYPGASLFGKVIGFVIGYLLAAVTLPLKLAFTIIGLMRERKVLAHNRELQAQFAS